MKSAMNQTSSKSRRTGFSGKILILLGWIGIILVLIIIHQVGQVDADSPRTITVDDDAPEGGDGSVEWPFNRIQEAIDAADEGNTIRVWEGVYYENVVVNKTVTIIGNGTVSTTIDGGGNGSVVKFIADEIDLSGFTITGGGKKWGDAGIEIDSENNTISQNDISFNNRFGVYIHFEEANNNILGNEISENADDGIFARGSGTTIYDNIIFSNKDDGIWLDGSETIMERILINNNKIFDNDNGLILLGTLNTVIKDNEFSNDSISIRHNTLYSWNTHVIENNTVNNKPIYYFCNQIGIDIPRDAGQIILANCTNITIQGFSASSHEEFIQLGYSSNIVIKNNSLTGFNLGISLWNSSKCWVDSNLINYGVIYLGYASSDNLVYNNLINRGNISGIWISGGSHNNSFINNSISDITNTTYEVYGTGIWLDGGMDNHIVGNTLGLCRKVVNKKFNFINRIKRKTSIWEVHGLSQRDVNPVYKKS